MSYREIFGDVLADHHENPRFLGKFKPDSIAPGHQLVEEKGYNPVCGDKVEMHCELDLNARKISQVKFEGEGCSICMASASILAERIQGTPIDSTLALIEAFREKMQGKKDVPGIPSDDQVDDDLVALYGIQRFPVRIKCALLAWTTLRGALMKAGGNL